MNFGWGDPSYGEGSLEWETISWLQKRKNEEVRQCVERAWRIPYQGSLHHLLLENIKAMKGSYQNMCAIFQSSGTGKSRMVDEQAKLVYTLPMNVRTKKGVNVAYPPPDDPLCEYLAQEAPISLDRCREHYFIFFKHLFSHAIKALDQIPTDPGMSGALLATKWYQHMEDADTRRNFYKEVVEMCRADSILMMSSTRHEATENHDDSSALHDATNNLRDLIKTLDERSTAGAERVKIVIYIDEAHDLNKSTGEQTQFDAMCSALASFAAEPLFVLLVSTQSLLPLLPPSDRASPFGYAQLDFPAPITEIPFDCAPGAKVWQGQLRVDDLWKFDYLTQWGRPLWWTTFQASERSDEGRQQSIMELARMKLLGRHDIKCRLSDIPSDSHARVAIIDVLLALDFERNHRSFELQTDMVKRHMRIAYSVPQHREYLRSGYPSEPVLAEAAAQQINEFKNVRMNSSLDVMVQFLLSPPQNTLVDLGEFGEVVARLLLMQAYLDAVVAENVVPLVFSRGCQLVSFITQLFSPKVSDTILASHPDNGESKCEPFSSAFKNSVVRFTHFVKAIDDCAVTTEALFAAFARGMAFICYQTQDSIDIAIPILYDKTKPLEKSNITAVLVQVNKRREAHTPWTYQFRYEASKVFPDNDKSDRPYITLVLELGAEKHREPIYVSPAKDAEFIFDTHPCYHITAYGCSVAVYKAVGGSNSMGLKELLATRNFLQEHPRYGDSRSLVMKMKPAWGAGEDSFHWVSH